MDKKPPSIEDISRFKHQVTKQIGLKKMILFGSVAHGRAGKHSDVDLIVVSNKFKGKSQLKRPLELSRLWNFNYPVDFICYTSAEFRKLSKQVSLVSQALHDGVEI